MKLWSPLALKQQLQRVRAAGWLPYYQEAAGKYGFSVPLLLAVTSRETNCKNIIGDNGHGHGLGQVDDRSYGAWCRSGLWKDPQQSLDMAAAILAYKKGEISASVPKEDQLRVALAAYNTGAHNAVDGYFRGVVDTHTTGRDYSKDVLARAEVFAKLLGEDDAVGKVGAMVPESGRA